MTLRAFVPIGAILAVAALPPRAAAPTDLVFTANQRGASVSILDATNHTVLATLPTGDGPHEVVVSPDGRTAIVTNYGGQGGPGNSLTIIDVGTQTVRSTITLGDYKRPHCAVFLPGGKQLVVTSETNMAVLIVDLDSAKVVHAIPTTQRGSHMIAVRRDGRMGYTANITPGSLTEIDIAGRATGRVLTVATNTEGVAVTPDGSQVWMASRDQHKLFLVDTKQWKVTDTLDSPGLPYRVGITPDGKTALVTSPSANLVRVFDVKTKKEVAAVMMPERSQPVGVAIAADGKTAYISCQGNNTVQIIDLTKREVVGSIPTGLNPDGIAVAHIR